MTHLARARTGGVSPGPAWGGRRQAAGRQAGRHAPRTHSATMAWLHHKGSVPGLGATRGRGRQTTWRRRLCVSMQCVNTPKAKADAGAQGRGGNVLTCARRVLRRNESQRRERQGTPAHTHTHTHTHSAHTHMDGDTGRQSEKQTHREMGGDVPRERVAAAVFDVRRGARAVPADAVAFARAVDPKGCPQRPALCAVRVAKRLDEGALGGAKPKLGGAVPGQRQRCVRPAW